MVSLVSSTLLHKQGDIWMWSPIILCQALRLVALRHYWTSPRSVFAIMPQNFISSTETKLVIITVILTPLPLYNHHHQNCLVVHATVPKASHRNSVTCFIYSLHLTTHFTTVSLFYHKDLLYHSKCNSRNNTLCYLSFFPPSLKIATTSAPSSKPSLIYASQLLCFKIQTCVSTKILDLDA